MSAKDARLAEYRRRREFSRTREPEGRADRAGTQRRYVVQIHDASSMHFDFRLEVDGVLKSWAVPKGPSSDPRDKRLAMPTEDHPLEYRDFEGVIPAGEYGAGTVIIWDEGTYQALPSGRGGGRGEPSMADGLRRGHVSFRLHGAKLRGAYALTRIRGGEDGEREAWLLVRHGDRRVTGRGTPDPERARSARSGRTLAQMAADPDAASWDPSADPSA